jgi:uncharacterized protein
VSRGVPTNVEVLREMYEAFNSGNVTLALSAIDSDIEWRITPDAGPSPQTYHGHGGVRSAVSSMLEVWEEYSSRPVGFIETSEHVVALLRSRATGKASGADVEGEIAHLWRMRDGKAVSFEAYASREDALRAAEARERGEDSEK